MSSLINIIKREFKNFLNEPGALLIMIIGVFAYSLFYSIPYSAEIIKEVPIGLIDMDNTEFSAKFIRNLNTSDYINITKTSSSLEEAQNDYYKNKIKGFVIIPKDFERDIKRGKQATISLYTDTSYMIVYKAIYTGIAQTAMETAARIEIAKLMKEGVPKQLAKCIKQPFQFIQTPMYNAIGGYKTYVYPVILILILHQTLLVGIGLIQGTANELKYKFCEKKENLPLTLFGKATTYVLLYLFYSIIIFLIYPALFTFPMSYNLIPLFILLVLLLYAAAFFAYTLSYFFRTRESSLLILVVTSLMFIFIPGLIWPRESIPQVINVFSFFIPATCGIDGIIKIDQMGANLSDIIYDILWLAFLCILYFNLSIKVLREK
jgi:ABC-2 type transport system permease protein